MSDPAAGTGDSPQQDELGAELADRSREYLLQRLQALDDRVRAAVAERRHEDPSSDDPFRGLYISESDVDRLLRRPPTPGPNQAFGWTGAVEAFADGWEEQGERLRLRDLARTFDLDLTDTEILLVAMAPDLDPRFERLYGYLHDDVSRRRASIGLALELCGLSTTDPAARARLAPSGSLIEGGLILVEERDRPLLGRSLRVPDRVTAHLLGDDTLERDLTAVSESVTAAIPTSRSTPLERALVTAMGPIYLRESGFASAVTTAASSAAALGGTILLLHLDRLANTAAPVALIETAIREARTRGVVLVATPIDVLVDSSRESIALLAEAPGPVVLIGQRTWDPAWSSRVPVALDAPSPTQEERLALWRSALAPFDGAPANGHLSGLLAAAGVYRLAGPQIDRAAMAAALRARAEDRHLEAADLQAGARAQNGAGLERLARRVEPHAGWDGLILPLDTRQQLEELAARARHRDRVLDDWGAGHTSSRGRGLTGLFAGESGTGKTLAAEVIAADLGLDLYVIDLSTVVDKYIGETEKNLDRIFEQADRVNGVLLFDEADAIFGKRSEVRDARDRYANLEVAYLLQRMERFDGVAILTTNLRANLDDAFTRRIDVIVDFPQPDAEARLALWRMHLPARVPLGDDLDLEFVARSFRLAGGSIRNICLTATFLAADEDQPLSMAHVVRATEREYRKLGRLTLESEFGPYHALIAPAGPA